MANVTINGISSGTPALTDEMELQHAAAGASLKSTVAAIVSVPGQTLVAPNLGTPASGTLTNCTAFTLTTTGSSGAATYSAGTLNVPQYSGGAGTPGGSTTQVQYNNAGAFGGITGATTNGTALTLVAPVLGTPASGVLTNCTGTATGLTSGITNALKSATTTVDVSAATAPSSGQVLTATSTTAATWQTPSAGAGTVTHTAGALTANAIVLGNGAADTIAMASLGTTATVLHGNASGAPTFGAVNLATDTTGSIPVVINAQTGTTYTVVAGDQGKLLTFSNASPVAVTLPQATGSFTTGYSVTFSNKGAGAVTVTPTTSTIDGQSSVVLAQYQSFSVVLDGTNYSSSRGIGGSSSGLTVGTTTITSGTTTRVLYDNAGALGEYSISGTGNVAMTTSPTFVTPVLGTPASGNLANCTAFTLTTTGSSGAATYSAGTLNIPQYTGGGGGGGLTLATGTDANTTCAANTLYVIDMSAWATADRNYTMPASPSVGDRVGLMIQVGNPLIEVVIKGNTSQTINGGSAASEWSRLFITGEYVELLYVATNAWLVVDDQRIAQTTMLRLSTSTAASESAGVFTLPTSISGAWTADVNIGAVGFVASGRFIARRACVVRILANAFLISASAKPALQVRLNGSTSNIAYGDQRATAAIYCTGANPAFTMATNDYIEYMFSTSEGSKGLQAFTTVGQAPTCFGVSEIL